MKSLSREERKQAIEDYFAGTEAAGPRDYSASPEYQLGQGRANLTLAQDVLEREEVFYTDPEYYEYYLYQWPTQ
jgi:hypothetical protein